MKEKCSWHISYELGHLQFFSDCEERAAKGQTQKQCPDCGYWFWPDKFGKKTKAKNLK